MTSLPPLPSRFSLTPEFQLLVACSSPEGGSLHKKITTLCSAHVDWHAFISLVDRHQVAALVHATLCRHTLPVDAKERLRKRAFQVRGHALRNIAELVRLDAVFDRQQLDVISLKGPLLAQRLYGDPAMRHFQDLDLLVKPIDLDRADALLKANGYRRQFLNFPLTRKMREWVLSHDHHLTYRHDGLQSIVELHWGLDLWGPEHVAGLWGHTKKACWTGMNLKELDDAVLLPLLCGHGAGHRWSNLKWLNDVAALLAQGVASSFYKWSETAEQFDLEQALAQGALLAHWLHGTQLPGGLCDLINREKSSGLTASGALEVVLMDQRGVLAAARFRRLKYLAYTVRLKRKLPFLRYLRSVLMSSADFDDFPLPDRLFWLYYLLKPWLWLRRRYVARERADHALG